MAPGHYQSTKALLLITVKVNVKFAQAVAHSKKNGPIE